MTIKELFNHGMRLHWCKLTKTEFWGEKVIRYDWLWLDDNKDMYAKYANDYFYIERILAVIKKDK